MKIHRHIAKRLAALMLAAVVLCTSAPAALAADTIGGADTAQIPVSQEVDQENCISWLLDLLGLGSKDKITVDYLNVKGQGLRRNVRLNLVDCLVGITYTELGSIGSYAEISDSAAAEAWKAQAVAIHSYLEYQNKYGSSANALTYTPVDQIPSATRKKMENAIQEVANLLLVYNNGAGYSVCDAVFSCSAGYNTDTGVYGTCSATSHKSLGGFVQYNTLVVNGRSYRYLNQFVSSRFCFDFTADADGTPVMAYYGYGHGVGMSQCGAVGFAQEKGYSYRKILSTYYTGASLMDSTDGSISGGGWNLFDWLFGWMF